MQNPSIIHFLISRLNWQGLENFCSTRSVSCTLNWYYDHMTASPALTFRHLYFYLFFTCSLTYRNLWPTTDFKYPQFFTCVQLCYPQDFCPSQTRSYENASMFFVMPVCPSFHYSSITTCKTLNEVLLTLEEERREENRREEERYWEIPEKFSVLKEPRQCPFVLLVEVNLRAG